MTRKLVPFLVALLVGCTYPIMPRPLTSPLLSTSSLPTVQPIGAAAVKTPTPAPTPPGGLIENSSFEMPYLCSANAYCIANRWQGWYVADPCPGGQIGHPGCFVPCPRTCTLSNGNCNNDRGCSWQQPEFTYRGLPNTFRIHSGSGSQSYFGYGRMFWAGLYQTITATVGMRYLFSVHAMMWECANYDNCQGGQHSDQQDTFHFKVGIDPTGGDDPFSASIIWSAEGDSFDRWSTFSVMATAQADHITVWTHTRPDVGTGYLPTNMDQYIDDALLIQIVSTNYFPEAGR